MKERQTPSVISAERLGDMARELRRVQRTIANLLEELEPCDAQQDGERCTLGWHSGVHRSEAGVEWLDS